MATVALPSVGPSPTLSLEGSRRSVNRLLMLGHTVTHRFVDWSRLEARADAYASYAAFGFAAIASVAVLLAGHF